MAEEKDKYLESALDKTNQRDKAQSSFMSGLPNWLIICAFIFIFWMTQMLAAHPEQKSTYTTYIVGTVLLLFFLGKTKTKPQGKLYSWEALALLKHYLRERQKEGMFRQYERITIHPQMNDQTISGKPMRYRFPVTVESPYEETKEYMGMVDCFDGNVLLPLTPFRMTGWKTDGQPDIVIPKLAKQIMEKGVQAPKTFFQQ